MKTVLIVLGSGGHTAEMIELTKLMGSKYRYKYLISDDDNTSKLKIVHKGKVITIPRPTRRHYSTGKTAGNSLKHIMATLSTVRKEDYDAIISTGPGICIFPMFISKLRGKRVIFIETISRVNTTSRTGRMVKRFANQFFVQWKEGKKLYPGSIYAGRLM